MSTRTRARRWPVTVVVVAASGLVVAACSSSTDHAAADTTAPTTTTAGHDQGSTLAADPLIGASDAPLSHGDYGGSARSFTAL